MRIGIDARAAVKVTDGIGRYAIELLRAFSARNDDHEYVVLKNPETRVSFALDHRFREVLVAAERFSLREQVVLPGLLSGLHLDLFHSLHATLPVFYRGPMVMTIHDIMPLISPWSFGRGGVKDSVASRYLATLVKWSLRRATRVLVDSDHTMSELHSHLGVDTRRLRRVYLGFDHAPASPADVPDNIRCDVPGPFVLTLTNFRPHKNVPKLVDAFRIARRQLPDLWLVLAGDDPKGRAPALGSRDELEAEHVRVTGYVSEQMLTCLLSWTKAFVFPSLYEGFGFPILEAMANGAPVITSRVASLPEIGDDAVVYIDPNDPQGIADAIVSVCTNRDVQKRLRERGLRQATKFRWQETADQTFEAYQEAVHHGRDQSL